MIALEGLPLNGSEQLQVATMLEQCKRPLNYTNYFREGQRTYWAGMLLNGDAILRYQLFFTCRRLAQKVEKNRTTSHGHQPLTSTVVLDDGSLSTSALKLSPERLSVRCDSTTWASIRSHCAAEGKTSYYEVKLLTGGLMRIGWATKLADTYAGRFFEDQFSVGFDGYHRVIWHDDGGEQMKRSIANLNGRRWKAGDVVGCLLDGHRRTFRFYLNGEVLEYASESSTMYFSQHLPYHAAVSLFSHQHCIFNFGQYPFRYRPAGVEYTTFSDIAPPIMKSFHLGDVTNSVVTLDGSTSTMGDMKITTTSIESSSSSPLAAFIAANIGNANFHYFMARFEEIRNLPSTRFRLELDKAIERCIMKPEAVAVRLPPTIADANGRLDVLPLTKRLKLNKEDEEQKNEEL